ncbi:hypothetical protein QBC37DRAFT_23341 [Rhypophila decipiens]|uniref:Rhodopsin domain-containing protein n=1 Tax=Rhypophila decipiens TaxID=261697 RepID=A0AAN6Y3W5_9PEZI|nr:hypothetical protein QBC37DRAFT_23341 [Rhypophila decipiens]
MSFPSGPPPPDIYRGDKIVIASTILHVVSLPIVATRIWTRLKPNPHLWWDDWTILVAVFFDLLNWVLILLALRYGFARPTPYVPLDDQPKARAFQYFAQHASGWAIGFGKLSIALMLFRLRQDRLPWRIFLWGMMIWAMVISITVSGTLFAVCKPVRAMWDFTLFAASPPPVCQDFDHINRGILACAAMTVITDFILSLLPLSFILQLQRSLRERIIVSIVMGLGLIASAASLCKIVAVTTDKLTGDGLVDGVNVTFWGILEIQLGIIAACTPCLKRLAENGLRRIGFMSKSGPTFYHAEGNNTTSGGAATKGSRTGGTSWRGPGTRRDEQIFNDDFDEVPVLEMTAQKVRSASSGERVDESWISVHSKC